MRITTRLWIYILPLLISACSHMVYQPDQLMYYPPELTGFDRENLYFLGHDEYRIHAWFFKSKQPKPLGTIVQFHGNAQNISSHYVSLAWLTQMGYNLFIFDYRGYGESLGAPSQEKIHKDSLVVLEKAWALSQETKAKKFIVYGQSLGGAILLRAIADSKLKDKVDLMVLDSTFLSYKTVGRQTLGRFFLTWPFSPLGWLLLSDEYAPKTVVAQLQVPLLVVHDKSDPVIDFSNGEQIFAQYTGPKEFWTSDHGAHIGTFFMDKNTTRERFVKYLSQLKSRQ